MSHHLKGILPFPNGQALWYRSGLLFALLLVAYMVSGCGSRTSKEPYENSVFGISLEKPGHWNLEFYERSGSIVLEAESRVWKRDSARIEIYGYACVPGLFHNPDEELESNMDRIGTVYNLGSVTVAQEPIEIETGDKEVTKATITIPTMSLPEDSAKNQTGEWSPDIFQTIDMFAIRDGNNHSVMVYVYRGNSEELNAEAEAIVDSIQLTCSIEP